VHRGGTDPLLKYKGKIAAHPLARSRVYVIYTRVLCIWPDPGLRRVVSCKHMPRVVQITDLHVRPTAAPGPHAVRERSLQLARAERAKMSRWLMFPPGTRSASCDFTSSHSWQWVTRSATHMTAIIIRCRRARVLHHVRTADPGEPGLRACTARRRRSSRSTRRAARLEPAAVFIRFDSRAALGGLGLFST
jgi:hypothetical protein